MDTSPRPSIQIPDLDPLLGPVSSKHALSLPQPLVLALIAKAHANGVAPRLVKLWIKSRLKDKTEVILLVDSRTSWPRLCRAAANYQAERQRHGSLRLGPRAARRLAARVLTPVETGGDPTDASAPKMTAFRLIQLRHTVAILGLELIRSEHQGMDTALTSDPWIAVQRGIERNAARRHRQALTTELRWVALVSGGRPGFPARIRLTKLTGDAKEVGDTLYETIGNLSAQEQAPDDELAIMLASAAHPAWTYGGMSSVHWLVATADAAGIDPVDLGVAKRTVVPARKIIAAAMELGDTTMEALEVYASQNGCHLAYEAAELLRREAAAARKAEIEAIRAEKTRLHADRKATKALAAKEAKEAEAREVEAHNGGGPTGAQLVAHLIGKCGPLPLPTETAFMNPWLAEAKPLLEKCSSSQRGSMATVIGAQMTESGWRPAMITQLQGIIRG